jgi:hypothetical protein
VSDLDTFATGEAFIKSLSVPAMDAGQVRAMIDGDGVMVDLKDMSISINGQPRPHPPKMLHDCGPMRSEYGSGKITISTGAGSVTFDSADLHEDVDNK